MNNLSIIVATTDKNNFSIINEMNIHDTDMIVCNQCGRHGIEEKESALMINTDSKGVGINRNLGLLFCEKKYGFIVDDDMVFYEGFQDEIRKAIAEYPNADIIIFNFDYYKNGKFEKRRVNKSKNINVLNCLHYGICCTLVNVEKIKSKNIWFSTLFGGGCKYGSGEDSLFFLNCVESGLKVYLTNRVVGRNEYRQSTWFNGYNEKFFFDKGAWLACAFPKMKYILVFYLFFRLIKFSNINFTSAFSAMWKGIYSFDSLKTYSEVYENEKN